MVYFVVTSWSGGFSSGLLRCDSAAEHDFSRPGWMKRLEMFADLAEKIDVHVASTACSSLQFSKRSWLDWTDVRRLGCTHTLLSCSLVVAARRQDAGDDCARLFHHGFQQTVVVPLVQYIDEVDVPVLLPPDCSSRGRPCRDAATGTHNPAVGSTGAVH